MLHSMKSTKYIVLLFSILLIISCNNNNSIVDLVTTNSELQEAIKSAKPGSNIILKNGVWKDVKIKLTGEGILSFKHSPSRRR